MPTYSYACTVCDHRFDAQQSFSDPALTTCPECDGTLRKLFGNVGVVFKGSGFYRNDSRAGAEQKFSGGLAECEVLERAIRLCASLASSRKRAPSRAPPQQGSTLSS